MQYEELKVGKKGEVYTTKKVRKKVGIVPDSLVIATVKGKKIIIERKPSATDLLEMPRSKGKPVSSKDLSKMRKELAKELEER